MNGERESRRWNPTAEQLRILDSIYIGGNHRPTTVQIHHITHELRRHGNVEGINVFYWFKNRKARDRRKMRTIFQPTQHPPTPGLVLRWSGLHDLNSDHDEKMVVAMEKPSQRLESSGQVYDLVAGSSGGVRSEAEPMKTLELFPVYRE